MRNNLPRTRKNLRTITQIAGILLLAAALVLYLSERLLIVMEARECERISSYLENLIPECSSGIVEARYYVEMPAAAYQGNDYIALLEVPGQSVSLAVAAKYEEKNNTKCPGRLSGSAYDGTLTIIGYGGSGQFAFLNLLDFGDAVTVTDMLGQVYSYRVSEIHHINGDWETYVQENYEGLTLISTNQNGEGHLLVRCQ